MTGVARERILVTSVVLIIAVAASCPPVWGSDDESEDEEQVTQGLEVHKKTVVTASGREELLTRASAGMSVIGSEEIEAGAAIDFAELLQGRTGVNAIKLNARDFNITTRGATSTLAASQLALVDGRSVYQDFLGFVMWDLVPTNLDEVAQIEVVRGPASAVWGANAMNGVINIRTKRPRELVGGSAMLTFGEVGTVGGSLRYAAAPSDEVAWRVSASYLEQDAWERRTELPNGDPLPPGTDFVNEGTRQPKLDFLLDLTPDDKQTWTIEAGLAQTSGLVHTGIGPFSIDPSTRLGYAKLGYRRGGLGASIYANILDGQGDNLINGLDFGFDSRTIQAELKDERVLARRHLLTCGVSGRASFFDLSIAPLEDRREELGAFIEDSIFLGEQVRLNLGGRLDWFDTIGGVFSPRASLLLTPHKDHTIRLMYSRAYRAPSLINNYLETSIPNALTLAPTLPPFVFVTSAVGDPELEEEVLDALEIGYNLSIPGRGLISVSVYRNRTRNLINFAPVEFYGPDDPPDGWPLPPALVPPNTLPKTYTYVNTGEVVDKGIELAADLRLVDGANLSLSYTYQFEPVVTQATAGPQLELGRPPEHQFAAALHFAHERWFGSAGVTHTDEAYWTDVLDSRFWGWTEAFTLVNASIGVRAGRLSVAVKATNLFDRQVQQHVFGDIIGRRTVVELRTNF